MHIFDTMSYIHVMTMHNTNYQRFSLECVISTPGVSCGDQRFTGGDRNNFYFNGKKHQDFTSSLAPTFTSTPTSLPSAIPP